MKKSYLFAACCLLAMSACVKEPLAPKTEPEVETEETRHPVLRGTTESATTKVELSGNDAQGYQVLWQVGDRIRVDVSDPDYTPYPNFGYAEFTADNNSNSTTFTFAKGDGNGDIFRFSGGLNIIATYPYTKRFPATQTYVPGVIFNPMFAVAQNVDRLEDQNFQFRNIGGIIRLNLSTTLEGKRVREIRMDRADGASIYAAGDFDIYKNGQGEYYVSKDGYNARITLDCGEEGVAIGSTPTQFYLSVFENTYSGIRFTVLFTDGTYQQRTAKGDIVVERSKITNISLNINSPGKVSGSAPIKGGGTQPYVQLWIDGPKWAKFNVGSTITSYAGQTEYTNDVVGGHYSFKGRYDLVRDPKGTDETATLFWGAHWRTPTFNELSRLARECTWEYCDGETVQYEPDCTLKGWKVTGETQESIFLPLSGYSSAVNPSPTVNSLESNSTGAYAYYWSSEQNGADDKQQSYWLDLSTESHNATFSWMNQKTDCSVRAICIYEPVPEGCTDLSANETANSYIVNTAGSYRFLASVAGNGSDGIGGVGRKINGAVSADLLWATFGTNTAPGEDELIRNVRYANGYVYFDTGASFQEGNALIAVRNAYNTILWSWHIWFESDNLVSLAQTYPGSGAVLMDRNLGATSAVYNSADYLDAGMFYQWGRKDPFPGVVSRNSGSTDYVAKKGSLTSVSLTSLNIASTVGNPATFANGGITGASWAETKTIFDPCPPGWKVPAPSVFSGISGKVVWTDKVGGSYNPGGGNSIYIPAGGLGAHDFDSGFGNIGTGGYLYTNTTDYSKSFDVTNGIPGRMQAKDSYWACNVRCVRE